MPLTDIWDDTKWGFDAAQKRYVVETNSKAVERCILMTSDPGDLVFDPTCGSGTSAFCAEKWGRRWATCDTSRVSINVARQRLLASTFGHYKTRNGTLSAGILCKAINKITLSTLAYDLEPEKIDLVDQPEIDTAAVRITGPFEVMSLGAIQSKTGKAMLQMHRTMMQEHLNSRIILRSFRDFIGKMQPSREPMVSFTPSRSRRRRESPFQSARSLGVLQRSK
jgi:adenine-specific DNA-methyltransferase